jgi:hypothetical protein
VWVMGGRMGHGAGRLRKFGEWRCGSRRLSIIGVGAAEPGIEREWPLPALGGGAIHAHSSY